MKLLTLKIVGYKRLKDVEINFADATYLIGANSSGKSSTLKAIDYFLSGVKKIPENEFYQEPIYEDGEPTGDYDVAEEIVIEGKFVNVPLEANEWRGFKGRILKEEITDINKTGQSIFYKKTYKLGKDCVVQMKGFKKSLYSRFSSCKTIKDFIDAGASEEELIDVFEGKKVEENLKAKDKENLELINSLWEIDQKNEDWFTNPGGLQGNVLSRLPKFVLIPAETSSHEIENESSGSLHTVLKELFVELREDSPNYKEAQKYLNKLALEMDPTDEDTAFGNMMTELNTVMKSVFPDSKLRAEAILSNPDTSLKPKFSVTMTTNVETPIEHQGTGVIRSAVFALLRYRHSREINKGEGVKRSLIIGFEEPEIYLHPNAVEQMKDTIYELASGTGQIIATTHSPLMIDLSRKERQILNRYIYENADTTCIAFNVSDKFKDLQGDDKHYVKMLLKIDHHIAKAFFSKRVIVVEGDTEELILNEALKRLDKAVLDRIRSDVQIVKARGKASIISFVKYLDALSIDYHVIHDRDGGVKGAEKFNKPISEAVGCKSKISVLEECIEDVLGYAAPSSDKPYHSYKKSLEWGDKYSDVPGALTVILDKIFAEYLVPKKEEIEN